MDLETEVAVAGVAASDMVASGGVASDVTSSEVASVAASGGKAVPQGVEEVQTQLGQELVSYLLKKAQLACC